MGNVLLLKTYCAVFGLKNPPCLTCVATMSLPGRFRFCVDKVCCHVTNCVVM